MTAANTHQHIPHNPPGHKIKPRLVTFNITENSPQYWFDNAPFKTHFFNTFFTTFPAGENFFVKKCRQIPSFNQR